MKRGRLDYSHDNWASYILMHIVFFGIQLFFFWLYFSETPFTVVNIPVIYYRIQEFGYPTVLLCSLIWMNRHFFPDQLKHLIISVAIFIVEWFGINRLIIAPPHWS